ncbi:MAG: RNA polymerase sigma factor [Kofleriaceae bacterium]
MPTLVPLRRVSGETSALSDEALLAACGTGDSHALGALFDRFHEAVYRFAGRLATTDGAARDDLVQATFLEIRRTASTFRGTSSVRTWIFGVTANIARHALRSERRRRARQARFVESLHSVPMQVDESVEQRRLLARVEEAIADLPRDLQVTFIMCDLERLPATEVARVLEIPEGTLWRRLHTARKSIREAIERTTR